MLLKIYKNQSKNNVKIELDFWWGPFQFFGITFIFQLNRMEKRVFRREKIMLKNPVIDFLAKLKYGFELIS